MIRKPKDIYLEVAERHELPIDIITSIGNTVFQELRSFLNNPQELSFELPELGSFNMRFRKFENFFRSYEKKYIEMEEPTEAEILKYDNAKVVYDKMQEYRRDKAETKQKRNEQNETIESSESDLA